MMAEELRPIAATVVYLGPKANEVVSLLGRVTVGGQGERSCSPDGISLYDFSRELSGRLMPTELPPRMAHLAGRPFCHVEHPEHLWRFFRRSSGGQLEFAVIIRREEDRRWWIDYVVETERKLGEAARESAAEDD